jgi:hypothetical protein
MRKFVLTIAALLFWTGAALAQHSHGAKGPNGGKLQDVAGQHVELVIAGATLTFYVLDESNKPVNAKGYTGSVLVVSGGNRETLQLEVVGDNTLKTQAKEPLRPDAAVTLLIKTAAGKSGQVKF